MDRILKRGFIFWIAYYHRSKEHRENSPGENKAHAPNLLKNRNGDAASGQVIGVTEERLTFDNAANILLIDCEVN